MMKEDQLVETAVPMRNAMNELLRRDYAKALQRVAAKWNRAHAKEGSDYRIELPNPRFFRRHGIYANTHFDPQGTPPLRGGAQGPPERKAAVRGGPRVTCRA